MCKKTTIVTVKKRKRGRLPEWANEYCLVIDALNRVELLPAIEKNLKINRQGGYSGVDIFLFILGWFCYPYRGGLKEFSEVSAPFGHRFAAMAGRNKWPTQSSISRGLSVAEFELITPFTQWLLGQSLNVKELKNMPSALYKDGRGQSWHMFDYDPTVTGVRQRALPESEALPAANRYSDNIGKPGYMGRKRGQVQFDRAPVQHAGTGLWIHQTLGLGRKYAIDEAAEAVKIFANTFDIDLKHVALRFDGGINGVAPLWSCRDRGISFNTRIARYDVLDLPQIAKLLSGSGWSRIVDSGSGPQREALDIGKLRLTPSNNSTRCDGTLCQPIETRVVVTRILARDKKKHGAGEVKGKWQYEMFANDYDYNHWSAADCVADYYGRCGQENRFGQEDKELELDHIFNYQPAGQLLATSIGLFLWNLRTLAGGHLLEAVAGPLRAGPISIEQVERTEKSDEEHSEHTEEIDEEHSLNQEQVTENSNEQESVSQTPSSSSSEPERDIQKQEIYSILENLDWTKLLRPWPNFGWDQPLHSVRCHRGKRMKYHNLNRKKNGTISVLFRASGNSCRLCEHRSDCTTSDSPHFRRQISVNLKPSDFENFSEFNRLAPNSGVGNPEKTKKGSSDINIAPLTVWQAPPESTIDLLLPKTPLLIPSVLRHEFTKLCFDLNEVTVSIKDVVTRSTVPLYCVSNTAQRQHRRKTWKERLKWNALPQESHVKVRFCASDRLSIFLNGLNCARAPSEAKAAA